MSKEILQQVKNISAEIKNTNKKLRINLSMKLIKTTQEIIELKKELKIGDKI